MNRGDIALLGPRARAQIEREMKLPAPAVRGQQALPRRTKGLVLACCTDGCDFPPTSSMAAMERHCDGSGHHRYRVIL